MHMVWPSQRSQSHANDIAMKLALFSHSEQSSFGNPPAIAVISVVSAG